MTPTSTYRLQLHAGFGFDDAAAIADYLSALGVSHVYCSPYLQAAPHSMHGYDVVDHSRVNSELGGQQAHERFCLKLGACHLGQVLDIVPNHMSIGSGRNRWWRDVLTYGPSSAFAGFFDIEWHAPEEHLRNKILLPILGKRYGLALAAGELSLERAPESTGEGLVVRYYESTFPISPASLDTALSDEDIAHLNRNHEQLHALLERQYYRLSYWRAAERDLGYRRFFDVNSLVGIRVEDPRVFAATHALVISWLHRGVIDGLRVDHPDGLRDPAAYFHSLRAAAPHAYIVAEKILEPGEQLRPWPIQGTTGYDFLNVLGGLFVDPSSEGEMTRFYADFTGETSTFHALTHVTRLHALRELLGSDVNSLAALFLDICERHRDYRDFTRHEIHHALRELAACFPVYRTYVRAESGDVTAEDIRCVERAIACAKHNRPELEPELFDFIQSVLLLRVRGDLESEFAMRFQQFTGPVMAKGVEDTAFYLYNRLVSLNEVGGDPGRFGVSVHQFHDFCRNLQQHWPHTMLATSTHDTKRSEDVRARLSLLSEIPKAWSDEVHYWASRNEKHKTNGLPDRNTEYLVYQTMLGAWPISLDRLHAYVIKAVREGKRHSNWSSPNEAFESALQKFLAGIYSDAEFLNDFEVFLQPLIDPGYINSLSQVLLKLTAPGVPDIYQGTEIWDLSLVDPDNRRPVDFAHRRALLSGLGQLTPEQIWQRRAEGLPKLWTVRQTLRHIDSFGPYTPIYAAGHRASHLVAFFRGQNAAVIAPRLVIGLDNNWNGTSISLPEGVWTNAFTGDTVSGGEVTVAALTARFPVALLIRPPSRTGQS
jgi:(1->4)-alpha-D-glucan 1-alpha-D-glucosylmutase